MYKEIRLCKKCKKNTCIIYVNGKYHSGLCTSCSQIKVPEYQTIYNHLVSGAKRKNIPISLTFEEFVLFTKINECIYCKNYVTWTKHKKRNSNIRYNLDRKDNSKGYTLDNCVVCCKECNYIKSDKISFNEMLLISNIINKNKSDSFYIDRVKFMNDNDQSIFED